MCQCLESEARPKRARLRAVVGVTLALGGGAGCSEPAIAPTPIVASSETRAAPAPRPEPAHADLDAEEARYPRIDAAPGFLPDPLIQEGTTSGGSLDASEVDERCAGYIGRAPDHLVQMQRPFAEIAIMVASPEDTSLLIVDQSGRARCSADDDGLHPVVRETFGAGAYRVWVATAHPGARQPYLFALSELETRPSQLTPQEP